MSLIRTLIRIGWWLMLVAMGMAAGWFLCSYVAGGAALKNGLWGQVFLFASGVFLMLAGIVSLLWNIGGVSFWLKNHRKIAEEAAGKAVREADTQELIEKTVEKHREKIRAQMLRDFSKFADRSQTQAQVPEKEGERK